MAYIWKKPNSRYWQAGFVDIHGKRRNASTGLEKTERNRSKALRVADEYESVSRRQKGALQVKETLAQLLKDVGLSTGEELLTCTVREYAEKFIENKKHDVGASSISSYRKSFENLADWLAERADMPMEAISPLELKRFRSHLVESFAEKTATRKLKAIKTMFTEAHADGYCLVNPAFRLDVNVKPQNREDKVTKRPFTLDEIKSLIENATEDFKKKTILTQGL